MKALIALACALLLSACSSLIHKTTDEPIVEDPASRTMGEIIDDNSITTWVEVNMLKKDDRFEDMNFTVLSHNAKVLLIGQVSSDELKELASQAALESPKVKTVHNELEVREPISASVKANDIWISTQVKSKMFATDGFPSRKIKVTTENGVVYLMGLVTPTIANQAVSLVSNVDGVQRVVKVFEIIN